jgi:hypothetical protein
MPIGELWQNYLSIKLHGFILTLINNQHTMKRLLAVFTISMVLVACHESEDTNNFTGNETVYDLQSTSTYNISGTVTFKELRSGKTSVEVKLIGTSGTAKLPVHLHLGDISTPGAEIAALLSPVDAKDGVSQTQLTQLADESMVLYADLIKLNACIKIHLSDVGPERDIILAGGNVGASASKAIINGRTTLSPCKSE